MTTDLKYLAWTALLTASLWIPYIVCQVMTNGNLRAADYLDPTPRPLPLWGQRLNRAHQNAVEVFAPFAALVLVAQITSKADAMTAFWAALFFWARLAHAIVFALGDRALKAHAQRRKPRHDDLQSPRTTVMAGQRDPSATDHAILSAGIPSPPEVAAS